MNQKKNKRLQDGTVEILEDMLVKLRERDETGVKLQEFIAFLENKKNTGGTPQKKWNPVGRSKERTVFRYIQQLKDLGCRIGYKSSSKTFVLESKDWQFPENNWSLSSDAILKVGDLLLPILKDIVLPQDILVRIDEGLRISIKDKENEEVRKTVVSAWSQRIRLQIQYDKGNGKAARSHIIEPHGLVFRNSKWQVAAREVYPARTGKAKTFFLSKIVEANLVIKPFSFDPKVLEQALGEDNGNTVGDASDLNEGNTGRDEQVQDE
jgi:hypothetical protein